MTRRIDVEFGLTIGQVSPEELAPILEAMAKLARNGKVQMSPETQQILAAHAPQALAPAPVAPVALAQREPRRRGNWPSCSARQLTAALTQSRGCVQDAARALDVTEGTVYRLCRAQGIIPRDFVTNHGKEFAP